MKHLPSLTPAHAAFLAATTTRNRALFGGYSMELDADADADKPNPDADKPDEKDEADAPDPDADKPEADKDAKDPRVTKANSEAARYRTERNTLREQVAAILKAINPDAADETPTVETVTKNLTAAQSEAQAAKTELAVTRAAIKAGVNTDRLLDSKRFLDSIKDADAAGIETAITAALEADPTLKTALAASRSGNDDAGGTPPKPSGFAAELARVQKKNA